MTVCLILYANVYVPDHFPRIGVDITANRLFGPQPRTATYVCIWEIDVGCIKALLSASEGRLLAAAGEAARLNYVDFPNAPATEFLPPVDPDGMRTSNLY